MSDMQKPIEELKKYVLGNNPYLFDDWEGCRKENPELGDFFEVTEREADKELMNVPGSVQNEIKIFNRDLIDYLSCEEYNKNSELQHLLITYFGLQSIYDRYPEVNEDAITYNISVDNVGIFRGLLILNIVAFLYHSSDPNLPFDLKVHFEKKEFIDILGPLIKDFFPLIFKQIRNIELD